MTNAATLRLQAASLALAAAHGDPIKIADLELVEATLDLPVSEVAEALGRTYWATTTMRRLVREGVEASPRPVRVAASDRPYRGWVEGMGEE